MEIEAALNLDYRDDDNKKIIQEMLKKIKPLSKFSDSKQVPIDSIEKLCKTIVQKYNLSVSQMKISYSQTEIPIYSIDIKNEKQNKLDKLEGSIYGMCLYETFAKLGIKLYSEVTQGNVTKRELTKEETEREKIAKEVTNES